MLNVCTYLARSHPCLPKFGVVVFCHLSPGLIVLLRWLSLDLLLRPCHSLALFIVSVRLWDTDILRMIRVASCHSSHKGEK